jgi:hypothetical protein
MRIFDVDVIPEDHCWRLQYQGECVGYLFLTHHSKPLYEVYYEPLRLSRQVETQREAVLWVMQQIKEQQNEFRSLGRKR